MLNVTVKTLDSQNHVFQVEDDISVQNFKDHIVSTVNVPAEQQRLIYRGRVLQNDKKLSEYSVDNNTIHLVQRPPQSTSESGANDVPTSENSSGPRMPMDPSSGFMFAGGHGGDSFIMGTIGIPSVQVGQNTVASAPTVNRLNSAARRLQTGNDMLSRASTLLTALEEDDEVANARSRIIPEPEVQQSQDSQASQQAAAMAMAGSLMEDSMDIDVDDPASFGRMISQVANAASAAAVMASMRAVNESGGVASGGPNRLVRQPSGTESSGNASLNVPSDVTSARQSAPRLRELAIALQDVITFHSRLTPFLQFMEDALRSNRDYTAESGELRSVQYTFDTLSAVMHCLGHSYHAFSDLICDFATPSETRRINAPATILVEQSTVVRATIPIAVPHFHTDRQNQPRTQTPNNNSTETSGSQPQSQAQQPIGQPGNIGGVPLPAGFPAAPGGFMFSPRPPQGSSDDNGPGISINIQANGVPDFASLLGPAFRNPRPAGTSPMGFTVNGAGPVAGVQGSNQSATGGTQPTTTGGETQQAGATGASQSTQQRMRNDFLRQGFDALLNCHSHHISLNRNVPNRPSDFRQYVQVRPAENSAVNTGSPEFFDSLVDIVRFSGWLEQFHPLIKDFVQNYLMRGRDIKNNLHIKTYARTLSKRFLPLFKTLQTSLGDKTFNSNIDYEKTFAEVLTRFFYKLLNLVLNSESGAAFKTSLLLHWDQTMLQLFSVFKLCFPSNEQVPTIFAEVSSDWSLPGMSLNFRRYLADNLRDYFTSVSRTAALKEHTIESLGIVYNQQLETENIATSSVEQVPTEPVATIPEPEPKPKESSTDEASSAARPDSPTDSSTFHDAMDTLISDDNWLDEMVDQIPIRARPEPPSSRPSQPVDVLNYLPQEWRSVVERDMMRQMSLPPVYPSSSGFESLFPTGRH